MKITFWGTRGSLPCPMSPSDYTEKIKEIVRETLSRKEEAEKDPNAFIDSLPFYLKQTFGGETPCLEITSGNDRIILDAGTGLRKLSRKLVEEAKGEDVAATFILSHTHWDHISGLLFFDPIYKKGSRINFLGGHEKLEERLALQHHKLNFPVEYSDLPASISFQKLEVEDVHEINGFSVSLLRQYHPGCSFAIKIKRDNKTIVYSTDTEIQDESEKGLDNYCDFIRGADVLIFDTMYSFNETFEKLDWGHSSSRVALKVAEKADIKKLVLFHHDVVATDEMLQKAYEKAVELKKKDYPDSNFEIINSYDSLELNP